MSKKRRPSAKRKEPAVATVRPPTGAVPTSWVVYALRVFLVGAMIATLWLTWPLWTVRESPPLLPLAPLPAFDHYGTLMIVTAATFIIWPRAGLAAHVLVSLAAMTADQTRMQPEIFSLWLLMLGTWPNSAAQLLGRCHLASLWFFSGLHKLLSPGYFSDVAPFLWNGLFSPETQAKLPDLAKPAAAGLAIVEMLLGVVVFVPRLRRAAAVVAVLMHCGVVWILHRHNNWNTAVWPWNFALAVVGATLIAIWPRSLRDEYRVVGRYRFTAALVLFLSPALFYVGMLDAYLCHCLYSANVPTATMYPAQIGAAPYQMNASELPYWKKLNVPQPPTHRNFELYFRAVAKPGDRMLVEDPRAWARWAGYDRYLWRRSETTIDRLRLPPSSVEP
jgi:uncharacterized membrane protein YphA (DoxX/SURF4 family)